MSKWLAVTISLAIKWHVLQPFENDELLNNNISVIRYDHWSTTTNKKRKNG